MCDAKMYHAFIVQKAVRGFHVYQCIWDAANDGEILPCEREVGNSDHPSDAVAIKKGATTLEHVPRKTSTVCCIFLRRGSTILCEVMVAGVLGGGLLTRLRIHRKAQNSSKENLGELSYIHQIHQYFPLPIFCSIR